METDDSGAADFQVSEVSPLTKERQRLLSEKIRTKRSSVEMLVSGLFKTFEYETAASFEDEPSESSEKTGGPHQRRSRFFGRQHFGSIVAFLVVAVVFFSVGWFSRKSMLPQDSPESKNTDEISRLKEYSAIEGLVNGAVAADHEVCSKVGTSILIKGGNAVDAAVATTLCLGVANPASSGLGGGAFILIHSSRSNHERRLAEFNSSIEFDDMRNPQGAFHDADLMVTEVIDSRETAPAAASQDMYAGKPNYASAIGGLAIAVPGELRGLELAHARHGRLAWVDVVEPAIQLALNGVPVSAHLAGDIDGMKAKAKKYGEYSALRRLLTKDDDWSAGLREGELLRNRKLANTLTLVAKHGSKAVYEGKSAETIANDAQLQGGILTADDLRNYRPVLRSPVSGMANGYTLVGVGPPSSGGAAVIGAARLLSGYKIPMASAAYSLAVHRTVEAMRHIFAIRMSLSDPAFFVDKTAQAVQDLTSGSYMESLREITMDNSTLPLSQYGGAKWAQLHDGDGEKNSIEDAHEGDRRQLRSFKSNQRRLARPFGYLDDFGTTHLSVVDKDGNAVAITSSVNNIFGSYVFSEETGILLGNTMDDFGNPGRSNFYGLKPSKENFIAPGKRVSDE